jgi:hypothetical protein
MISLAVCILLATVPSFAQHGKPFVIHITDHSTGRGVPLVELRREDAPNSTSSA